MITRVTFCSIRCSRSADTWFVVAPRAVTVRVNVPLRLPGTRTATLASFLLTSGTATRSWTTSTPRSLRQPRDTDRTRRSGEGWEKQAI